MLIPEAPEKREGWRWGTVTQVGPVQVRLDGDTAPLLVVPDVLGSASVGQRVYCHLRPAAPPSSACRIVAIPDTSGAWAAYTPTLSGITLGNGAMTARWARLGRTVHCAGRLTLGSTSSVTGSVTIGMPVALASAWTSDRVSLGTGTAAKSGAAIEPFFPTVASPSSFVLLRHTGVPAGPGAPWTWASGDGLAWNLTYEAGS